VWTPEGGARDLRPDVTAFVATLDAHRDLFDARAPVLVARAPGRLDLMGGIADYSGSLVLELPLECATLVAAQPSDDGRVTVRSPGASEVGLAEQVVVPLDALAPGGRMLPYDDARALLGADARTRWAAYVVGTLVVLAHERGASPGRGVRLLVHSTVPAGKGVSSSAALEVAAMQAVAASLGIALATRGLALLCQRVENLVVGAPCGVMDQLTSAGGEADRLLALRCQPAEVEGQVVLPAELAVWGIDSGIRHAVGGADYGAVRVGAFMGYRILADVAGLDVAPIGDGRVRIDDPRWGGYLANVTPDEWDAGLASRVPETMRGDEFLARYGGTTDAVTRVDPERTYVVRQPTAHPIHEHARVRLFRALLESSTLDALHRRSLGALMYASHASYSACGLGSDGTDRLVELVRDARPRAGLHGAKITGGGSGGVVAVLGERDAEPAVRAIADRYARETGRPATVLGGSSPGAASFGVLRVRRASSA
jgi:galactokinase